MSLRTYSIVQVSHAIWVIIPTSQNQLLKYSSHSLKPHVGGVSYNVIIFSTAIIRLSSLIVVFADSPLGPSALTLDNWMLLSQNG